MPNYENQNGGDSCGMKQFTGGSGLEGSEYEGAGEVNSLDMLKSGTSYVSHDFNDTKQFAGSYAPVQGGTHQCGGKKRRKSRRKSKRRKHQKKRKSVKRRKGRSRRKKN